MSRVLRALLAVCVCLAVVQVASPSSAELNAPQAASWGVSDFSPTGSVGSFSALAWAVEEANGQMFVGGKFLNVTNGNQTVAQQNLARFNLDGTWDSSFTPTVDDPVLSIAALPDGSVMLGKEAGDYNGVSAGALVKIDPATGDIWPGWDTKIYGGTGVVREVTLEDDGWLYAVGTFTTVGHNQTPTPVTNVVRLDPVTGEPDTSWTPNVTGGSVWDVSTSKTNDSVYLAGWFTQAVGAANSVVGIDTNDDTVATWTGFVSNQPNAIRKQYAIEATEFGTVWVGGVQHGLYVFDENQNMELAYNHITAFDSRFQANNLRRGGEFQEIERVGNRIYATCHCWGSHSSAPGPVAIPYSSDLALTSGTPTGSVSAVVAYDVQTMERDQSFNPFMAGDIGGFGVSGASDGCLWVAGGINAVGQPGDQKAGRDLVRLCDDGQGNGGGGGPTFEAPSECTATVNGSNIDVTWLAAAGAVEYVITRSVNGNGPHWRGITPSTSFADTNVSGTVDYNVASKSVGGAKSAATLCTFDPGEPVIVESVADCSAVVNGGTIDVTWSAAVNAVEYVIYRTVDGAGPYWRGKVSTTSFADGNRSGVLEYSVVSKGADGSISAATTCSFDPGVVVAPTPVDGCSVVDNGAAVRVDWTGAVDADKYVVYRTVNGGPQYWRGAVNSPGTSFTDSNSGASLEYFVSAKFGSTLTTAVSCGAPA